MKLVSGRRLSNFSLESSIKPGFEEIIEAGKLDLKSVNVAERLSSCLANEKFGAALSLILLTAVFTAAFSMNQTSSLDFSESDKALNCWNKSKSCEVVKLDSTIKSCNDWYIDNPLEQLECSRTGEGVGEVTLVSDPGNHITGEMVSERVKSESWYFGISDLNDLEFLPNGKKIISDSKGRIYLTSEGEIRSMFYPSKEVPSRRLMKNGVIGIKGLSVSPDFVSDRRIYVYYYVSNASGGYEEQIDHRGWKFKLDSFKLEDGGFSDRKSLLNISGAYWHSGGGVEFGPDGKLYVSVGEAGEPSWAQNPSKKRGKVLRINPDGSVPETNPFNDSYIYSLGHRNPQGIAWDPETGNMWSSEHGNKRKDEINIIEPGHNYGWGRYICGDLSEKEVELTLGEYTEPVRCFRNWTMAPSRMTFVDQPGHPWHGDLMLAGLRGKHVRQFEIENRSIQDEKILYVRRKAPSETGVARRIRDIEFYNGSIWLIGDRGRDKPAGGVVKLTPSGYSSSS